MRLEHEVAHPSAWTISEIVSNENKNTQLNPNKKPSIFENQYNKELIQNTEQTMCNKLEKKYTQFICNRLVQ